MQFLAARFRWRLGRRRRDAYAGQQRRGQQTCSWIGDAAREGVLRHGVEVNRGRGCVTPSVTDTDDAALAQERQRYRHIREPDVAFGGGIVSSLSSSSGSKSRWPALPLPAGASVRDASLLTSSSSLS